MGEDRIQATGTVVVRQSIPNLMEEIELLVFLLDNQSPTRCAEIPGGLEQDHALLEVTQLL